MTRMLTTDYFPSCKFQDSPHSLTSSALLLTSGQLQSARCWNNSGMWWAGRHFPFRFPSHVQRGMNGLAGCYGTCNVCCNSFSLKLFGQMNVFYVRFTHVFIFKIHSNWLLSSCGAKFWSYSSLKTQTQFLLLSHRCLDLVDSTLICDIFCMDYVVLKECRVACTVPAKINSTVLHPRFILS